MKRTSPNASPSANVLYITYDGLTDPLGRSQVLPYLFGLAERGHRITILSCEKPERMDRDGERIRQLCGQARIDWVPLKYHKQPLILSSMIDAAALKRAAVRLHRAGPFDLVHCRSYIPARAGLALKRKFGTKFLFDMRGFWPDEKIEGDNWNLQSALSGRLSLLQTAGIPPAPRRRSHRQPDRGRQDAAPDPARVGHRSSADHGHPLLRRLRSFSVGNRGFPRKGAATTRHRCEHTGPRLPRLARLLVHGR